MVANITTSSLTTIPVSLWDKIPAAAYVLLGAAISGFFSILTIFITNYYNYQIKNKELKFERNKITFEKKFEIFSDFNEAVSKLHRPAKILNDDLAASDRILYCLHRLELFLIEDQTSIRQLRKEIMVYSNYLWHIEKGTEKSEEKKDKGMRDSIDKLVVKIKQSIANNLNN